MVEGQKPCRNCGAPVTGEFCAACGQREGRADRRFLDLAGDLTGDVFDLDSRLWRTLFSLLFRPGHLTAEFIAGRRARYLPPLRLYLVISFILFLTIGIAARNPLSEEAVAPVQVSGDGIEVTLGPGDEEGDLEAAVEGADAVDPNDWSGELGIADENSPEWLQDVDRRMENNISRLRYDQRALMESMLDYIPQMMFLLLPLFALLIRFTYLFSAYHYLQHLVFALHYHSFAYLAYLLAMAAEAADFHADGWVFLALLLYLPLGLRRAYGSGWGGVLGRSIFIYFSYGFMLVLGFAAIALLALYLL